MSRIGVLMLSAYVKGHIRVYIAVASQYVRSSFWNPNGVSVRLDAPLSARPALKKFVCARRFAVMNAPYEWPPTAIRSRSATPMSTILSMAAFAPATSCSTYVSLGLPPFCAMMGMVGLSITPYPCVSIIRRDAPDGRVNLYGDPETCEAAATDSNSAGYAQRKNGSGPSFALS